jgi:hypothetical protein
MLQKFFIYFILGFFICNFFIFHNYTFNYIYAQTDNKANDSIPNTNLIINEPICNSYGNPSAVTIETDKARYIQDQVALINVSVFDSNGCPINGHVIIEVIYLGNEKNNTNPIMNVLSFIGLNTVNENYNKFFNQTIYKQSQFSKGTSSRINLQENGIYNISAIVKGTNENSFLLIKTENFWNINLLPIILVIAASSTLWILLIINSIERIRKRKIGEILVFILTSGTIFNIIMIFIFVTDDLGSNSPIGLVKKSQGNGEWIINIGGSLLNGYTTGIQIPVYVFIFGILGGYLRYLYKSSKTWAKRQEYKDKEKNHKETIDTFTKDIDGNTKSDANTKQDTPFYKSLEDISLLFLSPLLAIAVYFVLVQGGLEEDSGVHILAAISFTVGLITDDVIRSLIEFTSSKVGTKK